jgi:hypothetical protein
MCPGRPYMLGGGTSLRGLCRRGGPGSAPPSTPGPLVAIARCAALTISPQGAVTLKSQTILGFAETHAQTRQVVVFVAEFVGYTHEALAARE